MSPFLLHDVMPHFLALVEARAATDAAALAVRQLELGYRPDQVIVDLLAAAQEEVGRRWHQGTWSVADEHQATAVTDAALYGVSAAADAPRSTRGTAAVVCALGDWHTLPARMAAELLRLDGWDVVFLGGSLPAADLTRWLSDARPAPAAARRGPRFGRRRRSLAPAGQPATGVDQAACRSPIRHPSALDTSITRQDIAPRPGSEPITVPLASSTSAAGIRSVSASVTRSAVEVSTRTSWSSCRSTRTRFPAFSSRPRVARSAAYGVDPWT
jgi:B12 binding domain